MDERESWWLYWLFAVVLMGSLVYFLIDTNKVRPITPDTSRIQCVVSGTRVDCRWSGELQVDCNDPTPTPK